MTQKPMKALGICYHILDHRMYEKFPPSDQSRVDLGNEEYVFRTTDTKWFQDAERRGVIVKDDSSKEDGVISAVIVEGTLKEPIEIELLCRYNGMEDTLTFTEKDIFKHSVFQTRVALKFGEFLEDRKKEEWMKYVSVFIKSAERRVDSENTRPIVVDVINKIENSEWVLKKEDLLVGGQDRVWYDAAREAVWIFSDKIKKILDEYNVSLRQASELLKEYRAGESDSIRIGKKFYSMWQFNVKKLNIPERLKCN